MLFSIYFVSPLSDDSTFLALLVCVARIGLFAILSPLLCLQFRLLQSSVLPLPFLQGITDWFFWQLLTVFGE